MNLHDTSHCPTGARCESCGAATERTVRTAELAGGVICLTMCVARCAGSDRIPALSETSIQRFVLDHQGHLGLLKTVNNRGGRA